jgi:hypothetical protein
MTAINFMGNSPGIHTFDRWPTTGQFNHLFKAFLSQPNDPEVLLLGGTVLPNGTIEMIPMYWIDEAYVDEIPSGDYSLQLLDAYGNIVHEASFSPWNIVSTQTDPPMSYETENKTFLLTVPYQKNVQEFRITTNDTVSYSTNVTSRLLHDAIDAIPQAGFVDEPDEKRITLHNEVDEIESKIDSYLFFEAADILEHSFRTKLTTWLIDNYPTSNALEYSKQEILDLVDELVSRLISKLFLPVVGK